MSGCSDKRAAATAPDGYNLILAGPGSGKTRVITYRVAHLIARGAAPESVLLVTFTRRAAREMVGRLEGLIGAQAARVWAGTFHHIGNRVLRLPDRIGGDALLSLLRQSAATALVAGDLEPSGALARSRPDLFTPLFACRTDPCTVYQVTGVPA